jgi:PAS domain S-box-containing protein
MIRTTHNRKKSPIRPASITVIYCIVGGLYIIASDWFVGLFINDLDILWIGTLKGLGFVLITGLLLLYLMKREEKARERSETFYQTLVDSMEDALIVLNVPTRSIIFANPAASTIFGYSNDEFIGRKTEFLHVSQQHFDEFHNRGIDDLSKGRPFHTQFEMRRKDGSTFPSSHVVSLVTLSDGSQIALSMISDQTHLQQSAQRIEEQEKLLRQVAENLREVFWISDTAKQRLEYVSPAYREVWGRDPAELYDNAMGFVEAVHEEDRDWVKREVERQAEGNYDVQYRIVRPDGEIRWIWDRARPIVNDQGEVYRLVGIAEDITQLKIREDELMHARKLEYLGQLSSGITHDFRNYLAVILSNAEELEDEITDSQAQATIAAIKKASLDAREMTSRLLAFARRQSLKEEVLNLNAVISALLPILNPMLNNQTSLETDLAEDLSNTSIDRQNLESCLINMVRNACDAMPDGGRIVIRTHNGSSDAVDFGSTLPLEESEFVCLSISDTGQGMDAQTCLQVFDPYFTTKDIGKGTGLGLSMVHGFVKQSRGHIDVESEVGKGTTFHLRFPRLN